VDNPERAVLAMPEGATIATDLTRDRIRDSFGTPSAISFWNLPAYIRGLEKAGFSARSHQVWFQMELALPLLQAAMVLIAAGFTMRHARMAQTGTLVLFALLSGFGVFFLRNFGQVLGENGQIPVLMAAWTPPVAAAMLALGFLLHLEDG
jgi:lipopolysaccharide export system permease protein